MPLKHKLRGNVWWVQGRCDGIDGYVRESLGTSDEAVAIAKVEEIQRTARKRALLGPDAPSKRDELTFEMAVLDFSAKPRDAGYLLKLLPKLGKRKIKDITGSQLKALAREMYPNASTDTWQRQVITPARAVINHMHDAGLADYLRVRAFTKSERIAQDRKRGKVSRQEKVPGNWEWLEAFMQAARARRNPYIAALAHFMFVTGARISQAIALEPDDMDLQNHRALVPAAKGYEETWVTLPVDLVVTLANLPPRRGAVFGYATRHSVYKAWKTTCTKAGIEMILPHAAGRHGFGTELMVRQGLDPVSVAKAGRWASPRVLLETYGHAEDYDGKVQEALKKGRSRTQPVQTVSKGQFK